MHKSKLFILFLANFVIIANFYAASVFSATASESFQISDLLYDEISFEFDEIFLQNKNLNPFDIFPEGHPVNSLKNPKFVPGEIIVKFKEKTVDKLSFHITGDNPIFGIPSIDKLNHDFGLFDVKKLSKDTHSFFLDRAFKLSFSKNEDIDSIMNCYKKNPCVEYVEPNYIYETFSTPDDTYFDQQWALNQNNDCDIDAPEAWNITTGSSDVTIAVIDTGVDYLHPDLADNIWNNTDESVNGIDNDGNGYIDDIRGWDFVNNDNNPIDDYGHGTHCAGIIGAIGNNSTGISGVCWNISIMPIKALNSNGSGNISDLVDAIYYATDNNADVISMSWGGYFESLTLKSAIEYAYSNGVVLVAAAGNYGINRELYPAAYEEVISVAATDGLDSKASFSNWGSWVDIAAPGVDIFSTMPTYHVTMNDEDEGGYDMNYDFVNGTSMACPHAAGIAGLLLSNNSSLSNIQIKNILKTSTEPVNSDYYIGLGRVNAKRSLLYDQIPLAIIDPSIKDSNLVGSISINGTANGSYFTNYSVFYGKGIYPTVWDKLVSSESQVNDSNLVTWNTSQVDDGYYTLKLIVNSSRSIFSVDVLSVKVNNVIETYYVGGLGPNNYTVIQNAINDAGNKDTVFIFNGVYNESVMVDSNIDIIGENNSNTIVIGDSSAGHAFWINSNVCNISNLNIQNTLFGFVYTSNNNSLIQNNKLYNASWSIVVLSNTTGYSIYPEGLSGSSSGGITIANNEIINYTYGIIGISNDLTIMNNTFDGEYYFEYVPFDIINSEINNSGILIIGSNNTISYNIFTNNFVAVCVIYSSNYNSIGNNQFYNNYVGVFVFLSNYNFIDDNQFYNDFVAIWIFLSDYNFIYNNEFYNNYISIEIDCSYFNQIHNNDIEDGSCGVAINGQYIEAEFICSFNNILYLNNLKNNSINEFDECVNTWYNQEHLIGNYWDDFDEPSEGAYDNNSDGIVDSPYNIGGGDNQDLYPLTGPWGERPYQATLISPSDGATGVSTSPTLKVSVTDPNGDAMNVSFYTSGGTLIGKDTNVASGGNATVSWSGRSYSKTYNWYVVANDSTFLTKSDTWSFRTKSAPSTGGNPAGGDGDDDVDEEIIITDPPVADADGPYEALTFKNIKFDGSGSTDNGTITNYTWNFGDGTKGYGVKPTHSYSTNGSFTVTLEVTDNDGLTDTDATIADITLDTDGDGWSDDEEIEYGSNATDYNNTPTDTDNDGEPDVVDDDDDNDGVPDVVEESIGSNQKSGSDVFLIDVNGSDFYLISIGGDLIYDCLYNPTGRITDVGIAKDGRLLLDVFGDKKWDYCYNPLNSEITEYKEQADSSDESLWLIMIIGIIIVVVLLIIFIFYKKKK